MKLNPAIKAACAGMLALLSACGHQTTVTPYPAAQSSVARAPATGPRAVVSGQRTSFDSVETYKSDVAEQIIRYNSAHTFSGKLPPMLPAIVVLTLSVDQDGRLSHVVVQRSRDSEASKVALAAVSHGVPYPKPLHLLRHGHKTLDFSETFLFGDEYHFKLRTLAGPQ